MGMVEPSTDKQVENRISRGLALTPLALLVLASVEPFIAFYSLNQDEYVQVDIILQLVAGTLLTVGLIYVILLASLPRFDAVRIASALAVFVFCFFKYNAFNQDPARSALVSVGAWALLSAVVVATVALWSRHAGIRLFLILYLTVSAVLPAVSVITSEVGGDVPTARSAPRLEPIGVSDEVTRTPDVWWLMMDQYGREDTLESLHGLDNGPFLADLEKRGFRVAADSYTSYPVTPLAVSSVLQLDHLTGNEADLREGMHSFTGPMRGEGRVVDAFREYGYRYLYADNGVYDWGECDAELADVCVPNMSNGFNVGHLTRTISELTPLVELLPATRIDIEWTVNQAMEMMNPDEPEFAFIHTLSPHEPYWFTEDCDYRSKPISGDFDAARYVHQIGCLNPKIIAAIDSITMADPEAIIVLQSDHGPAESPILLRPYQEWSNDEFLDRYAILEAMRFPDECATPEGAHSNVSTFEYVFACIEGRRPEPLPERYFFWHWNDIYNLVEIDRPEPAN